MILLIYKKNRNLIFKGKKKIYVYLDVGSSGHPNKIICIKILSSISKTIDFIGKSMVKLLTLFS